VHLTPPSFTDVLSARRRIAPYLAPTALHRYASLDALMGCEVWVKHENHQPVGAFKVRGGVNLIASLSEDERKRGVITASTGNHGQSIAFAGRAFGVQVTICVPEGANPGKVTAIRGLGAHIVEAGAKFEDAAANAERLARERGYRFIHSANEPLLIAGVATYALEMLEDQPGLEVLVVPVGLGSGCAGACVVAKRIDPAIEVIAVQAAESPAVHASWMSGGIESRPNRTFAEGLSTGKGAELTLEILRRHLDRFELASEADILLGMRWWIEHCHTLAESAAGAVLAATYRARERLRGKKVGVVCSGGNTSIPHLLAALAAPEP
jgi:threonine dehydratase